MSKIFYDHLVVREEIIAELDKHKIAIEEREELVELIDENIHIRILDVILTSLPKEKHGHFLKKFHKAPHDPDLLEDLKKEVADIEERIVREAKKVKAELLAEILRARKK